MRNYRCLYSLLFACVLSLCNTPSAFALLGEDYTMVTSYYLQPSRWPPEVEARIERFAKAQRDMRPQIMQIFKNDANQINKQVWVAQMGAWSFAEANTIRNAIMQSRSSSRAYQQKNELVFVYADGSLVYYQFNPLNYRVHTIWALDKNYTAGDRGAMPSFLWDNARRYLPQS
jgi:hypothetical protein